MSTETPNDPIKPTGGASAYTGSSVGDAATAERFVSDELNHEKRSRNATIIGGLIVTFIVGCYLSIITNKFVDSLQPHNAAEITEGIIAQQVQDKGPDLAAQLKEEVPKYIRQAPDYALEQLPKYRESIEAKVQASLEKYSKDSSTQLGEHLDTYLTAHKDKVNELLTTANDPTAVADLGPSLREELTNYIKQKPANGGESIDEQISKSLESLQTISKKMDRLAHAKDLTPAEKKTRHAIAVLTQSIQTQHDNLAPTSEAAAPGTSPVPGMPGAPAATAPAP